jgi:isoquinoline 1-oxidoreductase subunit beta
MSATVNLSRRRFLRDTSLAAGALVVGSAIPWRDVMGADAEILEPGVLVAVGPDGRVTMQFTWNELGQGAMTSLPLVVAEELCVAPEAVDVAVPIWEFKYGNNVTGGSSSMRMSWQPLREAAAAAREMLVAAGAAGWGVAPDDCQAENGMVIHTDTDRSIPYGDLVAAAADLPVPDSPPLKDRADYTLIGRETPRRDTRAKVLGTATYGFDLARPGLQRAAFVRPPSLDATVSSVDDAAALAIPGVTRIVTLDDRVAVLADDTWSAFKGRDALRVEWNETGNATNTADYWTLMAEEADGEGFVTRDDGDVDTGLAQASSVLEAEYRLPFISHAVMEPSSCTVHVHGDMCDVEGPTQAPGWVVQSIARALQLSPANIHMKSTYAGSAFGRRLITDYWVEGARLSREIDAPVHVVWSREDEMRHEYFRPASLHRLRAGLDDNGLLTTWSHKIVTPSIVGQRFPNPNQRGADEGAVSGIDDVDYQPLNYRGTHVPVDAPLELGWLRSVYDAQNALANECFMDELATAAGIDPVKFRQDVLPADSRLRRVLTEAAERAGWPEPSQPGRSVGIACHACFGSYGAQVAEVTVTGGRLRVHRIVSVLDCALAVNPNAVRAQMEGAVAMGLGIVLRERITFDRGRVIEGNFDDYEPLRLPEMPVVECHLLETEADMGGVGEPVLPPTAPAVLNAIFAATGKRIRELPIEEALRS